MAIIAIPLIINSMGASKFGILALMWMLIGYFSLFDFGVGRAIIQMISKEIGLKNTLKVGKILQSGLMLMFFFGALGGGLLLMLGDTMVVSFLNISKNLESEALEAFSLVFYFIPVVTLSIFFRSVLEAYQEFKVANLLRAMLGVLNFLSPVLVLEYSDNLVYIAVSLILSRFLYLLAGFLACIRVIPGLKIFPRFDFYIVKGLLAFGGWMTVTNIIGPLMSYLDRFFIGAHLSMDKVAYYSTPYDLIANLTLIPGAIVTTTFPMLSDYYHRNKSKALSVYKASIRYSFISMFPIALFFVVFSYDILRIWISEEFAESGSTVLKLLVIGRFFNGFSQAPFGLIQSAKRPDITSKIHLFELPLYILAIWVCIPHYGIVGAAVVWSIRSIIDFLLLFFIANKFLQVDRVFLKAFSISLAASLMVFIMGALLFDGFYEKVIFFMVVFIVYLKASWNNGLYLFIHRVVKLFSLKRTW